MTILKMGPAAQAPASNTNNKVRHAVDWLRFGAVEEMADLAGSYWRSIAEGAARQEQAAVKVALPTGRRGHARSVRSSQTDRRGAELRRTPREQDSSGPKGINSGRIKIRTSGAG